MVLSGWQVEKARWVSWRGEARRQLAGQAQDGGWNVGMTMPYMDDVQVHRWAAYSLVQDMIR